MELVTEKGLARERSVLGSEFAHSGATVPDSHRLPHAVTIQNDGLIVWMSSLVIKWRLSCAEFAKSPANLFDPQWARSKTLLPPASPQAAPDSQPQP
jgi:hypothetical protein